MRPLVYSGLGEGLTGRCGGALPLHNTHAFLLSQWRILDSHLCLSVNVSHYWAHWLICSHRGWWCHSHIGCRLWKAVSRETGDTSLQGSAIFRYLFLVKTWPAEDDDTLPKSAHFEMKAQRTGNAAWNISSWNKMACGRHSLCAFHTLNSTGGFSASISLIIHPLLQFLVTEETDTFLHVSHALWSPHLKPVITIHFHSYVWF